MGENTILDVAYIFPENREKLYYGNFKIGDELIINNKSYKTFEIDIDVIEEFPAFRKIQYEMIKILKEIEDELEEYKLSKWSSIKRKNYKNTLFIEYVLCARCQ